MKLIEVQITTWDKIYYFETSEVDFDLGGYVIVQTENGEEIVKVVNICERGNEVLDEEFSAQYIRKAEREDIEKALEYKKNEVSVLATCKSMIKKVNLPMKLVDAHFSIDGKRLTFAFIANGRVDFRVLLKDLVKQFKLNIRLQQIGIRDEIKINGDLGCCGHQLCCQSFYKELGNVTSDLADLQQITHRGSERLSGVCGRLKCCLTFEKEVYEECAACLPAVGTRVRTDQGRGVVIGWNTLKKSVRVKLDDDGEGVSIIEVPIDCNKKHKIQK
ncbi:hypothetical protein A2533_03160 [Candidatus Falkowbacteria bacterium RIFOXYD2_FULL_35_9]|uniref:PSP1 C-terminal domain-containing protein n=1 Tax=Candidatus Falkowbacteria bacterium RIFOXYC2_FULL_36_12 TaxID=1798002 RepID=A0A1F5SVW7_9BACT|nr:MAG: hypothetical protein A2478_00295 [Candidatus Falkowbacteria bacterium RIFOXYC2_FULL_36_12]OGF31457.1 MAG: hypothetical protein A2300_00095 [Candidatus Falkowbacteria bacterium RIFOXYB2_FULL_35_7]OGF34255.1 MAG: hypothetical protein A2223_04660 [Candidatus Falkowbacteria bacterium RIFOXYA2_FULL_35_8]OGF46972.1 MAG: hypothetical protein A2533_03160 [Candidatus Falkowbacteria bacterium RIFOXYD2_FULL_35_9]